MPRYDRLNRVTFMFFFSSRRRHTRSLCDWSSDVCSSDLGQCGECSCRRIPRNDPAGNPPEAHHLIGETSSRDQTVYARSEEHTSELQSHSDLVCRLLLEKKKIVAKNFPDVTDARARMRESAQCVLVG